jgi:hypothetical protein
MKKTIQIGHKLGYLNPKTGRYKFVEIVSMNGQELTMLDFQKVGIRKIDNIYKEQTPNVLNWLKEESLNFKDGRKILKHRPVKCNFMTEAGTRYQAFLNQKTN